MKIEISNSHVLQPDLTPGSHHTLKMKKKTWFLRVLWDKKWMK